MNILFIFIIYNKTCRIRKTIPGTVQFNKVTAELHEKRENIKAQVQFRHDLLESQRGNYKSEFDRLQGAKNCQGWMPTQSGMNELQKKAKQSLNGSPSHRIYSTKL